MHQPSPDTSHVLFWGVSAAQVHKVARLSRENEDVGPCLILSITPAASRTWRREHAGSLR
jgi:hypothetical protein